MGVMSQSLGTVLEDDGSSVGRHWFLVMLVGGWVGGGGRGCWVLGVGGEERGRRKKKMDEARLKILK